MLAMGRILVGLFLLANSGFTVVLNACLMPKLSCCTVPVHPAHADASDQASLTPALPVCCASHVAGGLNEHLVSTTLVSAGDSHKLQAVAAVQMSSPSHGNSFAAISHHTLPDRRTLAPTSLEKCVLNATLLL